MNSSESMNIFTIISGYLILSYHGYILSHRKPYQIQFINHLYTPEPQKQVFTIEMTYTQPSNHEQLSRY
jgi:hypothetical protein